MRDTHSIMCQTLYNYIYIYVCNVPKTVRIYLFIFSDDASVYATEGSIMSLEIYWVNSLQ